MTILVVGANGYIGKELVQFLGTKKHVKVVKTSHSPSAADIHFDLRLKRQILIPDLCTTIIYLAYIKQRHSTDSFSIELFHLEKILEICKKRKIKFIYFSSLSSNFKTCSDYARTKNNFDNLVIANNQYIVRPGIVIGGKNAGLMNELIKLAKKSWFKPYFYSPPTIYITNIDTIKKSVFNIISKPNYEEKNLVVIDSQIDLNVFIDILFNIYSKNYNIIIFIPTRVLDFFHKLLFNLGIKFRILEKFSALINTPDFNVRSDLSNFSLLRNFELSTRIKEASVFLRYIGVKNPKVSHFRKFILLSKKLSNNVYVFNKVILKWPLLVYYYDMSNFENNMIFKKKVSLAFIISSEKLLLEKKRFFKIHLLWLIFLSLIALITLPLKKLFPLKVRLF